MSQVQQGNADWRGPLDDFHSTTKWNCVAGDVDWALRGTACPVDQEPRNSSGELLGAVGAVLSRSCGDLYRKTVYACDVCFLPRGKPLCTSTKPLCGLRCRIPDRDCRGYRCAGRDSEVLRQSVQAPVA